MLPTHSQTNELSVPGRQIGAISTTASIAVALLFGGGAAVIGLAQLAVLSVGLLAGFAAVYTRNGMQDLQLPWAVIAVMVAMLALPLVQLFPLPPEVWRALPGREAENAIIALAGGGEASQPIALDPDVNLQLFASLVVLCVFSLSVARLDRVNLNWLLRIVVGVALVQFFIGAVQFSTAGATLDFFGNSHKGWLLGTFANRNHAGLFFACCILITAALFEPSRRLNVGMFTAERMLFFALTSFWLLATIGTGSRTGFVLALIAALIASFISLRDVKLPRWAWLVSAGALAVVVSAVMMSQRVQTLVDRYETVGDDQRWSIWRNSQEIIGNYMPWGSGFGTFSPVYNKSEPFAELMPTYVNNAHNDYLELLIEAGFPGAVVLGLVLVLVFVGVVRGARSPDPVTVRHSLVSGGIIFLFACHSVVDYPVRRMAMAMLLFLAFGLLLRQFRRESIAGIAGKACKSS